MKRTKEDERVMVITGSSIEGVRLEIAEVFGRASRPATVVDLSPQGALELGFYLIDSVRRGGFEVGVRRRREPRS